MRKFLEFILLSQLLFLPSISWAEDQNSTIKLPNTTEEYVELVRPTFLSLYQSGKSVIFDIMSAENEIILFIEEKFLNDIDEISKAYQTHKMIETIYAMCSQKDNLPLYNKGWSIRSQYYDEDKNYKTTAITSKSSCELLKMPLSKQLNQMEQIYKKLVPIKMGKFGSLESFKTTENEVVWKWKLDLFYSKNAIEEALRQTFTEFSDTEIEEKLNTFFENFISDIKLVRKRRLCDTQKYGLFLDGNYTLTDEVYLGDGTIIATASASKAICS